MIINKKPRARELGLPLLGTPAPLNAITDVAGVLVGYRTLDDIAESGKRIKTGVTAILPRGYQRSPQPVFAGIHVLNGNGEMTGSHWIKHGGYFLGPVCISNTHAVGTLHQAAVRWMLRQYQDEFIEHHLWAMPVVAETYDGVINDINGLYVTENDALSALDSAQGGAVAEGNVGGGNGMICYGFKGGTGTSSRLIEIDRQRYCLGALVQANHGRREWFRVLGVPVGERWSEPPPSGLEDERGSIIVILATDAPLLPHQLERLAQRAGLGLALGGTPGGNNSGDIFLAFSTANARRLPPLSPARVSFDCLNDEYIDPLYLAAVQATEEAILNAMLAAIDTPMQKPIGLCRALCGQRLKQLIGQSFS
ncbi:aminopeptidase [Ventosimonas gracilis]|uniref:Aminopeptidase n=1 Tax=Ventosimonas gracilis TaxID=1680762 RepID=A0A139SXS9_9GAMM|nr:P1 family peptidase [Ventosimonas gracilis]KXU39201.1 aminopeptidase [Ventosimonas gracilis]